MIKINTPYKQIRAIYNNNTIRVYQAYKKSIAAEAVKLGHFGNNFKMERMSWIKPSFLWMMYRSGWASKEGQEHILAIDIKRIGFDFITENAVISSFNQNIGITNEQWKNDIKTSEIRYQWDPERNIYGNPLDYRSIQFGLRGTILKKYVYEWTVNIEDITEYVKNTKDLILNGENIENILPQEKEYPVTEKGISNLLIK